MKLFKYKSLNGEGLLFALDMIVNKRIYLSTCEMMDDPHEGGFEVTNQCKTDNEDISFLDELKSVHEIVNKTRFTSFSTKADNPLLWAHYAGGYTGIAFEYDIPDNSSVLDLLPIEYSGEIGSIKFLAFSSATSCYCLYIQYINYLRKISICILFEFVKNPQI